MRKKYRIVKKFRVSNFLSKFLGISESEKVTLVGVYSKISTWATLKQVDKKYSCLTKLQYLLAYSSTQII